MSRNKGLKYFTLCVMNLYNIWVSLSEMSDNNIDVFHDILFFFDVPVCVCERWTDLRWFSLETV